MSSLKIEILSSNGSEGLVVFGIIRTICIPYSHINQEQADKFEAEKFDASKYSDRWVCLLYLSNESQFKKVIVMVGYRKKLSITLGEYPFVKLFTFESTSVLVLSHYEIFNAFMIL